MKNRRYIIFLLLVIFFGVAILLATSSSLLMVPLGNVPAGTLITWLGLVSLPLLLVLLLRKLHKPENQVLNGFRTALFAILLLAVIWGFVAFALAGNWAFNFSSASPSFRGSVRAGVYFWNYTYAVAGLPLVFLLVYGLYGLIKRKR